MILFAQKKNAFRFNMVGRPAGRATESFSYTLLLPRPKTFFFFAPFLWAIAYAATAVNRQPNDNIWKEYILQLIARRWKH